MKSFTLFSIVFISSIAVFGQSAPSHEIKKLEITNSPAYVLLGIQPTNIMRPSTPRDFSTGLQYFNVNGVLQPGFALEANPFNWDKKDKQTTNSFLANDYFDKRVWPAIKKNFAFSLATSATDTTIFGSLEKGTGLGYGIRATIIPGTVHKPTYNNFYTYSLAETQLEFIDELEELTKDLTGNTDPYEYIQRAMDAAIFWLSGTEHIPKSMKEEISEELIIYKGAFATKKTISELKSKITSERNRISTEKVSAAERINRRAIPFARDGFILELAYSGLFHLQNNVWDNAVFAKSGLWLTPSFRFDLSDDEIIQSFDILGVVRYLWNDKRVDNSNYLDFGLKFQLNRNKWNVSIEGVGRYAEFTPEEVQKNMTYSWIANFNYLITEDVSFRFSFGSNFNGTTKVYDSPTSAIIMGGLNLGILR